MRLARCEYCVIDGVGCGIVALKGKCDFGRLIGEWKSMKHRCCFCTMDYTYI